MATADQVDVVLTVKDAAYLQRLKADETAFLSTMGKIEASSSRAGSALNNLGTRGASNVAQLTKQTSDLSSQTGNLAAQFNDIGVQLAGGQSPFLIALQQGSQINQVLGQAGAGGAVKALGAAFASLLNPVSLSTIAIITLAGTAVQYFSSILNDGRVSTEVIKEQNDLIRRVAENWGEAVPALKAYVDQLDRAANAADTSKAYNVLVGKEFEDAKRQLEDIRVGFVDARVALQQFGSDAQAIDQLQAAFDALREKVAANKDSTQEVEALQKLLAQTVGAESIPALVSLSGVLEALSGALNKAAANTATLRAEQAALRAADAQVDAFNTNRDFVAEQERLNGLTSEQLALEREVARVKADASGKDVLISEQQALELAQGRLSAEERRSAIIKANNAAVKSGTASVSDAERERQAVVDLIAALELERSLVGATAAEKAIAAAMRRAGAAATDEERAAIEELITATYAEQDALRAAEQAMQMFEGIASNAFSTFLNDIRQGKDAAESLSRVFDNIASQLIQIAVQGLIKQAFGGLFGGGGGIGGFLGGLFGGARANGGQVQSGKAYLVGERGPEPFIPSMSGTILPNSALKNSGSGGGGEVLVTVVGGEYFDARVETISGNVSTRVTTSAISTYDGQLSSRTQERNMREGYSNGR